MEKKGVIVLGVFILFVSISLVNADFMSDAWNKITGKVVENETSEDITEVEPEECPSIMGWRIKDDECVSDSGCDYDDSGYIYYDTEEECVNQLKETEEEVEEDEETEESEPTPAVCVAKISITFNKEIFYVGDEFKFEIGIFDSQGDPISNYPFSSRTYTYKPEGMWHTPEVSRTDRTGYKIFEGIIERGGMTLGKTKHQIYTEAHDNCPFVEETIIVEVREKGIKPVPCGIGTCIPEEEVEDVKAIPEERIFYKCNGCELEDKCYPMGYRKEGKYCSDNNEFIEQLGIGTCDNSFECTSNVCISGECVGEGLIKKVIKWFKKLFGGDEEPEPEPSDEICRELLIEENIENYEYFISEYGKRQEQQVAVYSEDGEQIDIVKCCMAGYLEDGEAKGTAGVVCPFDNRKDVENSLYWLSNKGEITLEEYNGQEVYVAGNSIIWIHKDFIVAAGTDPNADVLLPEDIVNAYLDKYPNDLG